MGRLAPAATARRPQAEVDGVMRELARAYPDTNATLPAEVLPFWQSPRGPQRLLGSALALLQGVMLLLLLAVCGNTANLDARAGELAAAARSACAWRSARGRWRSRSLLLTENLLLALVGAALGAAIAVWGTEALRAVPIIGAFPIRFQTRVDAVGLAFAARLGLLCGVLFGIAPAVAARARRSAARAAHRARARRASPLRDALMAREVALAMVVLLAAGLFFELQRDARHRSRLHARRRAARAPTICHGRNLDGAAAARLRGAGCSSACGGAGRRGRGDRLAPRCRSTFTVCRARRSPLEGRRARDGDARSAPLTQHRHAGLLPTLWAFRWCRARLRGSERPGARRRRSS